MNHTKDKFAVLRKQAEATLKKTSRPSVTNQDIDFFTLLHELDTYRIELELQNDELQEANKELKIVQDQLNSEITAHYRHYDIAPVGYVTLNAQREIVELNNTLATMCGITKEALLNHKFSDYICDDDQDVFYFFNQTIVKTKGLATCQLRIKCNTQDTCWVKLDCIPEQNYHPQSINIAMSDISMLKVMEKELVLASSVFDHCAEAIIITDADLNIVKINNAFSKITGLTETDAIGNHVRILQSGKLDAFFYQQMWAEINKHQHWQGEVRNKRKNSEIYPGWLSITKIQDENKHATHYVGILSDIMLRKKDEAQIYSMAYYDPLTHLPNRVLLKDRLNQALAMSQRNHQHGALFMMDIDHFKVINDSLGHLVGDELLQEFAKRMSESIREEDTISRMGGDEFVILLTDLGDDKRTAAQHAVDVAKKIIKSLSKAIRTKDHEHQIAVSIGIAMYPSDAANMTDLMKLADNAMYQVKKSGRNSYHFITEELQQEANERLKIQGGLHTAIARHEFELYYQPQVDIATNAVIGVEALIRWQDPNNDLLSLPENFIAIAEDTRLIIPIGTWVIEQACRQIAIWNDMKNIPLQYISVNISGHQFMEKNFVAEVERIISEHKINSQQLELEVTEGILIQDLAETQKKLMQIKAMGVSLAIDDFGTGYSSLQYLKKLPIDLIKIDQSFVRDIGSDKNNEAIISAIIALAKSLEIKTLAEGVETQQHLDFLKQHDCNYYQGYFFSKPVNAASLMDRRMKTGRMGSGHDKSLI